jgi:hypothetical protein
LRKSQIRTYVEIMLATGERERAHAACAEVDAARESFAELGAASELAMYVVQHKSRDSQAAFSRGERLIKKRGRARRRPRPAVLPGEGWLGCNLPVGGRLGRGVQGYVDSTLGGSSENRCYEVAAEQAFARQPLGIPESAVVGA